MIAIGAAVQACAMGCVAHSGVTTDGRVANGHQKLRTLLEFVLELDEKRCKNEHVEYEYVIYSATVEPSTVATPSSGLLPARATQCTRGWYTVSASADTINKAQAAVVDEIVCQDGLISHTWRKLLWKKERGEWREFMVVGPTDYGAERQP